MSEPFVSVLTPTYNHERFIHSCVESVLAQSYRNWEMVIVDDGSTDRTVEVIQRFSDPRIRLLRQPHLGIPRLADTYNRALDAARGELCAILEGDDAWPPWKVELQVRAFADKDVVLAWGRGAYVDEAGNVVGLTPPATTMWTRDILRNDPLGRAVSALVMGNSFLVPACSVMIRRDALLAIGGFVQPEGMYWVDRPTALRLALQGHFSYVDEVLGYWRVHGHQVSQVAATEATLASGEWFFGALSSDEKERYGLLSVEALFRGYNQWLKARRALLCGRRNDAIKHCVAALMARHCPSNARAKAVMGLFLALAPHRLTRVALGSPLPFRQRWRVAVGSTLAGARDQSPL